MPISSKSSHDPVKQLTIKVKACQRLLKEVDYYRGEVKENEAKLQAMEHQGKDPYDIKKFKEVLGESQMMVPDSEKRLQASLEDVKLFLDLNNSLEECDALVQAREILQNLPCDSKLEETQVEDGADVF